MVLLSRPIKNGGITTEDKKLEDMLPVIFKEIIFTAEIQYRQDLVSDYERMKKRKSCLEEVEYQRIEDEKQAEIERQQELEQARVDKLLTDAENFRKANNIRKYVADVLKEATSKEVGDWAKWAQKQADRIDPVKLETFLKHA